MNLPLLNNEETVHGSHNALNTFILSGEVTAVKCLTVKSA